MERRILLLHGAGSGKTSALMNLIDNAIDARPRVFISFNYDAVIDGQHRVRAILDGLDDAEDSTASTVLTWVGSQLGISPELLVGVEPNAPSGGSDATELKRLISEFKSFLRSALRGLVEYGRLLLLRLPRPDHPTTEFLIERRWFLLHGNHPPRPLWEGFLECSFGGCSSC